MPRSAHEEILIARTAIAEALKRAPQAAVQIADALQALDRLVRLVGGAATGSASSPLRRRRNQPKFYRVEGEAGQEALCEYRAEDADRPFRCPKATYDALARVMATTTKLTKFPAIEKRLKRELGELPAAYQIRVALRFWTTHGVDVVERIRARYRAAAPARFQKIARELWEQARAEQRSSQSKRED